MEVLNIRKMNGAGNLRALASVKIGSVVVHDFRIIQQPGQGGVLPTAATTMGGHSGQGLLRRSHYRTARRCERKGFIGCAPIFRERREITSIQYSLLEEYWLTSTG